MTHWLLTTAFELETRKPVRLLSLLVSLIDRRSPYLSGCKESNRRRRLFLSNIWFLWTYDLRRFGQFHQSHACGIGGNETKESCLCRRFQPGLGLGWCIRDRGHNRSFFWFTLYVLLNEAGYCSIYHILIHNTSQVFTYTLCFSTFFLPIKAYSFPPGGMMRKP